MRNTLTVKLALVVPALVALAMTLNDPWGPW